ncbi:MAG: Nudix family hydrolase, partial [Burkholderiales bacterium]|nr:Nudix family hydrolase [Burkholderiales bacterium]
PAPVTPAPTPPRAAEGAPRGDPVDVAVAVLVRPDATVLLARRPAGKVYAGYWEFPGGKVEAGEAVEHALARELAEELGVEVERAYPWITRVFEYEHATVRLHFHRVVAWRGEPHCREHEGIVWQRVDALTVAPVLPANGPVLKALALPAEYAVSDAAGRGEARFLEDLRRRLAEGLRLVQVREKAMTRERLIALAGKVTLLARAHGARVLVNGDAEAARAAGADGVQLPAALLATLEVRPPFELVGASCHGAAELRRAEALGADFAVLGPVRATPTHPEAAPLGWSGFRALAAGAGIPVFAIGGLTRADFDAACASGAHGLAMIRGSWT